MLLLGDQMLPDNFTLVAELRVDWKNILKRIPINLRGHLLTVETDHIGTLTSKFKYPILAIPSPSYDTLNQDISLLNCITSNVNEQLVHKIGGTKFVPPLEGNAADLVDDIIKMFDAEIIDILPGGSNVSS
jgi:hypothetical protein